MERDGVKETKPGLSFPALFSTFAWDLEEAEETGIPFSFPKFQLSPLGKTGP
jgi:hypothetical protein